ncbi:TetR/AcrR family transcriptional regulator [Pontibacter qinzhouensis]|uniref:TetR/AcrR family transcriptional regulator n=1 Tax=Pontibacter qinzhouensis TaxID=2603253 RepID=A0A5C8KDI2_9BACT|nr:TetR/AcrR family transcriptional regulator [Pontibacter qinzhouensis]TXK51927.1 TetR/AcrR family transcriptional regulator [Pontibacter qinzhouensis]
MSKFQLKRDQSIQVILETAMRLFSEKGFEATSIRNISLEAEISLGLMYNYFESKEELMLEILKRGSVIVKEAFAELLKEPAPHSAIEQYVRHTVKFLKANKAFCKLLQTVHLQSDEGRQVQSEIKKESAAAEEKVRHHLINSGIPFPELEAKLLFASIDGMVQHYLANDNYPIDDVATLLLMKYR